MRLYVNIYAVSRAYGGPEEGGWWFDTGEPVGSIPVEMTEAERRALHTLVTQREGEDIDPEVYDKHFDTYLREKAEGVRSAYQDLYPDTGKSSSVLGGDDYRIRIEDHIARPYPDERPHYE